MTKRGSVAEASAAAGAFTVYNTRAIVDQVGFWPIAERRAPAICPGCRVLGHNPACPYASERHLVEDFLDQLSRTSPWGAVSTRPEFPYQGGRTDIVAVDQAGRVIAFEAKLAKWRDALRQAYRNTCFAHRSYVLLPKEAAMRASRAGADFTRRQVGICYLEDGVQILQEAAEVKPLKPWLSARAAQHVIEGHEQDDARRPD